MTKHNKTHISGLLGILTVSPLCSSQTMMWRSGVDLLYMLCNQLHSKTLCSSVLRYHWAQFVMYCRHVSQERYRSARQQISRIVLAVSLFSQPLLFLVFSVQQERLIMNMRSICAGTMTFEQLFVRYGRMFTFLLSWLRFQVYAVRHGSISLLVKQR